MKIEGHDNSDLCETKQGTWKPRDGPRRETRTLSSDRRSCDLQREKSVPKSSRSSVAVKEEPSCESEESVSRSLRSSAEEESRGKVCQQNDPPTIPTTARTDSKAAGQEPTDLVVMDICIESADVPPSMDVLDYFLMLEDIQKELPWVCPSRLWKSEEVGSHLVVVRDECNPKRCDSRAIISENLNIHVYMRVARYGHMTLSNLNDPKEIFDYFEGLSVR